MKLLFALFLTYSTFAGTDEYLALFEKIPHGPTVDYGESKILARKEGPVGIVYGEEEIIPNFKPNLPPLDRITRIEYGGGPDSPSKPFFTIIDRNEIELIYQIFERFSSRRLIKKSYFRINSDKKIEEVDLGEVYSYMNHGCRNGYYFYSNEELLLYMDSHTKDEQFYGSEYIFINHPMLAYINYKIEKVNQTVDTTPVSAPR